MKIHQLNLQTSALEALYTFYITQLGFAKIEAGPDHFILKAGHSRLRFDRAPGNAYYHFAFNIPSPDISSAAEWLRDRHKILDWNGEEIIDFSNWNAEAIYFKDPAGNICEFIARKNLKLPSQSPFDPSKICGISEIGLPTADIRGIDAQLSEKVGMQHFDCNLERFCAIGDEEGMFIVIDYNVKKWIPKMDQAFPFPFSAQIEQKEMYDINYTQAVFEISTS